MIRSNHRILYERHGDALAVRISGEMDHHGAADARTEIDEKLLLERPARVFLDLSRVDFMDSSGLGLIMGRFALVRRYGGKLAVLDPSDAVRKILSLAGMERIIPIRRSGRKSNETNQEGRENDHDENDD